MQTRYAKNQNHVNTHKKDHMIRWMKPPRKREKERLENTKMKVRMKMFYQKVFVIFLAQTYVLTYYI